MYFTTILHTPTLSDAFKASLFSAIVLGHSIGDLSATSTSCNAIIALGRVPGGMDDGGVMRLLLLSLPSGCGRPPKSRLVNVMMDVEGGFQGFEQERRQTKYAGVPERRTRGGKDARPAKPITDEDLPRE